MLLGWCVIGEMLLQSSEDLLLLAPLAAYLFGILVTPLDRFWGGKGAHLAALAGSLIGCSVSVYALMGAIDKDIISFASVPFAAMSFRIDPLSAYFLLVISTIGAAASLYAIGYLRDAPSVGLGIGLNGFLATMAMVVLVPNVFTFLFAWQLMSLVSFFLVIHHSNHEEVRRSGSVRSAANRSPAVDQSHRNNVQANNRKTALQYHRDTVQPSMRTPTQTDTRITVPYTYPALLQQHSRTTV